MLILLFQWFFEAELLDCWTVWTWRGRRTWAELCMKYCSDAALRGAHQSIAPSLLFWCLVSEWYMQGIIITIQWNKHFRKSISVCVRWIHKTWCKRQHIEKWSLIAVGYPLHDLLYLKKKPMLIEHEKGDRICAPWLGEPSVSFSKSWVKFLFLLKCNVKIMLESFRSWFTGEKQQVFLKVAEIYWPDLPIEQEQCDLGNTSRNHSKGFPVFP